MTDAAAGALRTLKVKSKQCASGCKICVKKTAIVSRKCFKYSKIGCRKSRIFCNKLCTGRTPCCINTFCFLPVLIYNAFRVYVAPCIAIIFGRLITYICCYCCRAFCLEDYIFTDNQFKPNKRSLELDSKDLEAKTEWIRASELIQNKQKSDAVDNKNSKSSEKSNSIQPHSVSSADAPADATKKAVVKVKPPQMHLFEHGINPSDIVQGQLGDCWLLAAIACMAEFPGAIEECFVSYETSERHKYFIQLYDARKGIQAFRKIYIDDYIPCHEETKRPLFANPQGNEMWVLLLEKAFAKFCGNYGCLDGGHTLWAMQAMTGCYCARFEYEGVEELPHSNSNSNKKGKAEAEEQDADEEDDEFADEAEEDHGHEQSDEDEFGNDSDGGTDDEAAVRIPGCWKRWNIVYERVSDLRRPKNEYAWTDTGEAFDNQRMWKLLKKYDSVGALIGASANNLGEEKREDGIVKGHAYTVKEVRRIKKFKLLHLRNPWGTFEWNGDWSDESPLWTKYPKIAHKLKFVNADDGAFWMCFKDFLVIFNVVEICDRSSIKNLHIDIHEDEGKYGVCKGCLQGCYHFWCCCQGCKNIYCGRVSSQKTVEPQSKWLKMIGIKQNQGKAWQE